MCAAAVSSAAFAVPNRVVWCMCASPSAPPTLTALAGALTGSEAGTALSFLSARACRLKPPTFPARYGCQIPAPLVHIARMVSTAVSR